MNLLKRRAHSAIGELLERVARSPGFHGIREQSWLLFEEARHRGYKGDLPWLAYIRKVSHGERLQLSYAAT